MPGMASMGGPGAFMPFLWLWVAMSAAMMLPALVPPALLAQAVARSSAAFVGGYFAVWTATGIVAFEAARVLTTSGKWVAAGAIAAAACYQLSPLKDVCLRRCRSPLGSLMRHGSLTAGLEHGAFCLGCCWALMLALLALGMASLLWMTVVAAVIFVEKVGPLDRRVTAAASLTLGCAAVWVAL
jgi:predicted metal-binding membrane protein